MYTLYIVKCSHSTEICLFLDLGKSLDFKISFKPLSERNLNFKIVGEAHNHTGNEFLNMIKNGLYRCSYTTSNRMKVAKGLITDVTYITVRQTDSK